ncbi:MAG: hypothetical protein WED33_09290 [Bacteroidia bacterium]
MRSKISSLFGLLIFTLLFSCKKQEVFENTPFIEYKKFEQVLNSAGNDSIGILHFYFRDGDGDLGLAPDDTFPPFQKSGEHYFNFIISYFEKQNGEWIKISPPAPFPGGDTVSNSSRIPFLTPDGQIKTLEGDLFMELFTNNPFSAFDTIKYEFSIEDRALNRSNTESTPEIIISK